MTTTRTNDPRTAAARSVSAADAWLAQLAELLQAYVPRVEAAALSLRSQQLARPDMAVLLRGCAARLTVVADELEPL